MGKLRIGVVGVNFGYHHIRTLVNEEDVVLAAIADAAAPHLQSLAERYQAVPYTDGAEMLANEELDGVILATSPKSRATLIRAAATRNTPIFVEKPWATNPQHARELQQLAVALGAKIMMGFSFRFLPAVARLRDLLDNALGEPMVATGSYITNWLPPSEAWLWDPENGGGYFNENSCHLFDSMNAVLGTPVSIQAITRRCYGRPSADVGLALVRYEGGAIASVAVGGIAASAMNEFPSLDLVCRGGQAQLKGKDHIWQSVRWSGRDHVGIHEYGPAPEALGDTRYSRAIRQFCNCIREDKPFPATIQDGVVCVQMADALVRSAESGERIAL